MQLIRHLSGQRPCSAAGMAEATLWFPLGRHYECVIEKRPGGWQLRVLERGATVLTHRIDEQLARRLLSARRAGLATPVPAD